MINIYKCSGGGLSYCHNFKLHSLWIMVAWVITSCSLVKIINIFLGNYCLHPLGRRALNPNFHLGENKKPSSTLLGT
jgi:hypothetical protein